MVQVQKDTTVVKRLIVYTVEEWFSFHSREGNPWLTGTHDLSGLKLTFSFHSSLPFHSYKGNLWVNTVLRVDHISHLWLRNIVPEFDFERWLGERRYPLGQWSDSTPFHFCQKMSILIILLQICFCNFFCIFSAMTGYSISHKRWVISVSLHINRAISAR